MAMQCAFHDEPDFKGKDGEYAVQLFRADSSSGGIIIETFRPLDNPGQRPCSTAHYFEEWHRNVSAAQANGSGWGRALSALAQRAMSARFQLLSRIDAARAQGGAR